MIEPMKALTLWQPWAQLIAILAKLYETRSWATNYRGPIAIHAAKRDPHDIMCCLPTNVQQAMFDSLYAAFGIKSGALNKLTTGAVIATAELVGCHKIVRTGVGDRGPWTEVLLPGRGNILTIPLQGNELLFGDWTPGRYAWELANVKLLDEPIPAKGKQGLWNWEGVS